MLLNSLQTMIDNTECILFVETPNSVKKIPDQITDKTYSPWIFSELNMIDVIRKKNPHRPYKIDFQKRMHKSFELNEGLKVVYDITEKLNKIEELKFDEVLRWKNLKVDTSNFKAERNLDKLYQIKGLINYE